MAERELAILVRAKGATQAATDIGKVDSAVTNVGKNATGSVDRLKGKFGDLKATLKSSETQVGLVGVALAGLENFVPPSLRPFLRGLEDINRMAPGGIPGLVGSGIKVVVSELKPILEPLTSAIGGLKASFLSPGGIGVQGRMMLIGETVGLVAAVIAVNDSITAGNTLLAESVHKTGADFAQTAGVADLQAGIRAVDAGLAKLNQDPVAVALNLAGAGNAVTELKGLRSDLTAAIKNSDMDITSAVARQKLSVTVNNSNKVYISSRDVVSTTTQTKVLAGGIQAI